MSREYYLAHRDEILARRRARYPEERARRIASASAYYAAHKAEKREYDRAYRAANRDRIRQRKRLAERAWLAAHPEVRAKRAAAVRAWRARNLERERAACRDYYAAHRSEIAARTKTYGAGLLRLGDRQTVHVNQLPPEVRELALLVKAARKAVAESRRVNA